MVDGIKVLTINVGSSSVKFAVFEGAGDESLRRVTSGGVERAGHTAVEELLDELAGSRGAFGGGGPTAVGHRVVYGGTSMLEHQVITDSLLDELRRFQPLDPDHLPGEIAAIEACRRTFPRCPHVACFDSVFHRDLPTRARLLPIPRRFLDAGVRRLGFHGLSYAYLLEELERRAGREAAKGRVVLAHLGSGASLAAVRGGRPIDTSMGFTPASGVMMGTRPGDMDPGLLVHIARSGELDSNALDDLVNHQCGLRGVSGTSSDMRELLERRQRGDTRAAEAVELFCYRARTGIGAMAAALGGLDTLVFAGGIGERSATIRAEICEDLEYLGIRLDSERNERTEAVISTQEAPAAVRVIPTDEEQMMARIAAAFGAHRSGP